MTSTKRFKDNSYNRYDNYEHIYCRTCGHSCYFLTNHNAICNYCGTLVYPSKRNEFKDMLMREVRKCKKKSGEI